MRTKQEIMRATEYAKQGLELYAPKPGAELKVRASKESPQYLLVGCLVEVLCDIRDSIVGEFGPGSPK